MPVIARLFALVCAAVLLASCGPEIYALNYTSFVDPAYRTRPVQARKVLVMAPTLGLNRRQAAEAAMAETLSEQGLLYVLGLDVFPPTRGQPTPSEVAEQIRARGLDGAVLLWTTKEDTVAVQRTRTVTETQQQTILVNGQRQNVQVQVQREVPYTEQVAKASYSASFMLPAGPTIWTAEANLTGTDFNDIAHDAGIGAIAKAQQDGVIAKPAPQQGPTAPPPGPGAGGGGGLVLPGLN